METLATERLIQEARREAAGSQWRERGLVFTTDGGEPWHVTAVGRAFAKVTKAAGLGKDWAPRDMRHTFVSLLSADGMAIEKIARLVGHNGTSVTETTYRHQIRPAIQDGAEAMDRLFPGPDKS